MATGSGNVTVVIIIIISCFYMTLHRSLIPALSLLPPFAFINNQKGFGFSLGFCNSRLNLIDSPPYPLLPLYQTDALVHPQSNDYNLYGLIFVYTVHIVLLHFAYFRWSSNHCRPTCRQRELIETPGVVLPCAVLCSELDRSFFIILVALRSF